MDKSRQLEVDVAKVNEALDVLREHFDAAMIFVSRHDSESRDEEEHGTVNVQIGFGNWYARFGHVRDWLIQQETFTRNSV